MTTQEALEAWREANEDARVAENMLSRKWDDYMNRRGEPPTKEDIDEVTELRRIANDRLTEALQASGLKNA